MSFEGIDHVAIAVRSLDEAVQKYRELLDVDPHIEEVPSQGVRVAGFTLGPSRIELLEPLDESSPISSFLDRKGEGIHHLALKTDEAESELNRVLDLGFEAIDTEPREGAAGYKIGFLHPRDLHGALVELAQPPEDPENIND